MAGGSKGGGGGGRAGGSGVSGAVEFPKHITERHEDWLNDIDPMIEALTEFDEHTIGGTSNAHPSASDIGATPWDTLSAYDPADNLDRMRNVWEDHKDKLEGLAHMSDYADFFKQGGQVGDVEDRWSWLSLYDLANSLFDAADNIDWATIVDRLDDPNDFAANINWEALWDTIRDRSDIDLEMDYCGAFDLVSAKAEDLLDNSGLIDNLVEEQDNSLLPRTAEARSRFRASLGAQGADLSSTFYLGDAIINQRHVRDLALFRSQLSLRNHELKVQFINDQIRVYLSSIIDKFRILAALGDQISRIAIEVEKLNSDVNEQEFRDLIELQRLQLNYILQAVGQMGQFENFKTSFSSQAVQQLTTLLANELNLDQSKTQMHTEIERLSIVANIEETNRNDDITINDVLWDVTLYQMGANILAAPGGGVVVPRTQDQGASSDGGGLLGGLGGALSGAAGGAAAGSLVGQPVLGAIIGGAAGLLGGLG